MPRLCPVCESDGSRALPFIEENINPSKYSAYSFASRKKPEFMCHRMVQCAVCDVVYADNTPAESQLAQAYHQAGYDSAVEAEDAAFAYAAAIAPVLSKLQRKVSALEIGTGTGIFLLQLNRLGFSSLVGVEPSANAIRAASSSCTDWIVEGMFNPDDFAPNTFDLVCCFMTMEHVSDPRFIMESVMKLLRPGGAFVTITHDYRSWVNRLMGKRSPIIDVEHLQIFSKLAINNLFSRTGYCDIYSTSFKNTYSLKYWLRISPLPEISRWELSNSTVNKFLNKIKLSFNVGNTITAGYKPHASNV
jgi:2-polyprenyl-3-methyl-5-hydroxy-6-metoxy-1,4-benzoquinol methylase